jgi:sRNA-binding carbon storage regulator CsrA
MLVLNRSANLDDPGVFLTMPDGAVVKVTAVYAGPNRLRIGFDAPRTVSITRAELLTPEERADLDARAKGAK